MYKAAIFDLDGTLADTIESLASAGNDMLLQCGFSPLPKKDYCYFAGDGADILVRRALRAAGDETETQFEKAYQIYCNIFAKDCTYKVKAFDGMEEVLWNLKRKNIKLGVLTNKPHKSAVKVVETLYGKQLFDCIVGQIEGLPKKPDCTGALKLAEKFQSKPEECLYIGDTNVDMKTGKCAGMYTVGVLWGFRTRKELEENHADIIIEKPDKLLTLL